MRPLSRATTAPAAPAGGRGYAPAGAGAGAPVALPPAGRTSRASGTALSKTPAPTSA
jgi:hypothetical protein